MLLQQTFILNFLPKLRFYRIFIVVFILSGLQAKAVYFEYTPELIEIQKSIVSLRLKEANTILKAEQIKRPENIAIQYLIHYTFFYRIMVQQDKSLLGEFEKINHSTLLLIQKLPETSPQKLFLKGSVHLQSALVKGAFNEYLSCAWDFRTAYQEINLNEKKFPTFISHKKELGALMALIGTFPKQYEWIVNVVGLEGNFDKGMQMLSTYIRNSAFEPPLEQQQAMVIYTLIQLNFGKNKNDAWQFCKERTKDFRQNLMHCYLRSYVAAKCGENDMAIQVLKSRPQDDAYEQVQYLNFMMGNCLLNQLDYSAAIWFKKYIAFSTTKGSIKEAYQKLSWISLLQSDTIRFHTYFQLMEKNTKDAGSELKLMKTDLQKGILPSQELLKARLLFDGGYYSKSLITIHTVRLESLKSNFQKLEWEYRLARIYQEENKLNEAIQHYKACLAFGSGINSYLLPNSCLQIATIYEQMDYPELAKAYNSKVFSYSNYDYESSLSQKAKSNLQRLK